MPFESIEGKLKKLELYLKLDEGANSLISFTCPWDELTNKTLEPASLTEEHSKGLLKILMSLFPHDSVHDKFKDLVKEGGEPTTIASFNSKLMPMGVRLNKSYDDMKNCGREAVKSIF